MWENAYLSIKNPKASRALKQALEPQPQIAHFAHVTPLHYIGNFQPQSLGPPLYQILDPHLFQGSHSDWKTWKNGKAFSRQGKVSEFWTDWKSQENHKKNPGKFREFLTNIICYFLEIFKWTGIIC